MGDPDVEAMLQLSRKPHQQGDSHFFGRRPRSRWKFGAKPIQAYVLEQRSSATVEKISLFLFKKIPSRGSCPGRSSHHHYGTCPPLAASSSSSRMVDSSDWKADIRTLHHFRIPQWVWTGGSRTVCLA